MDPLNRNRALKDHEAVKNAGFALSETVYEIGTAVNNTGVKNASRFKRNFDAMSPTVEVCERGKACIVDENRIFRPGIDATHLLMHPDGLLGAHGKTKKLALTTKGFTGLCRLVTPGGADYLAACPPEMRAEHMNFWLQNALTPARNEPKELSLWLRKQANSPEREVFGVFGKRYTPFGGDQILDIVMEEAPKGSKAIMKYDRYRGKIDIILHSDVKASDYVSGEYFKAGVTVRWAEDGTGGIGTESFYWRNLCLNLINLSRTKQKFGSVKHIGDVESIRVAVKAAIQQANQSVKWFAEQWNAALSENVLEKYDAREPIEIFQGLVYNKVVWMPGVAPVEQVARLMTAFGYEPFENRAGIINAVSRAAHEYSFESPWVQEELEETAGELLYNKVWNVYVPDEDRQEMFNP